MSKCQFFMTGSFGSVTYLLHLQAGCHGESRALCMPYDEPLSLRGCVRRGVGSSEILIL